MAVGLAAPEGLLLIGGEGPDGPVTTTYKSPLDTQGALGEWEPEAALQRPQADALGAVVGDFVYVYGGHDDAGPVGALQLGTIGLEAAEGLPENPDQGKVVKWDIANQWNLPAARDDAAGWTANGTLYLVGGADGEGPRTELYWSIPNNDGTIPEWKHLAQSDLSSAIGGLSGAAPIVIGPNVVLIGGTTSSGPVAGSARANIAPQEPFFQLGLVGATVPALKIDGEVGQQLGYLNANTVGVVNFVILLLVGWAFAHKEQVRSMRDRLRNRRRR
jgi:hypothetical protein